MEPDDQELETALRQLAGANLYRDNIFRVTGLPIEASPTQIRRRREEFALAAKLGTPLPGVGGALPRDPAPDADTIRAAFESLRSPTVRLTHELLWLWGTGGADWHDATIRAHCTALEAEYGTDPIEPDHPDAAHLDPLWKEALTGWATMLASDALWDWARKRVREIDDPRLTTGTVRRLRSRLPGHIVAVSAELAARAAEVGWEAADRHVELLDDSPFDEELVDRALRDAVRPAEERIRAACETAERIAGSDSARAAGAGRELITATTGPLRVVANVLDMAEPVTQALLDQVAGTVNRCAVICHRDTSDADKALELLRTARDMAAQPATIELIDNNIELIDDDRDLAGANRIMKAIRPLCASGNVEQAAAILRAMRRRTDDEQERAAITRLLADDYSLVAPLAGSPTHDSFFGIGAAVYGRRAPQPDGKFIGTHFLTALWIPVLPMAAYVRDHRYFYAKVRLSQFALWWRRIMSVVLVGLVASVGGAAVAWWITAMFCVLGLARMGYRELRTPSWVARQADS